MYINRILILGVRTQFSYMLGFIEIGLIWHEKYTVLIIVLRHVLLLNLRSQLTRPYTINTRLYFSPAVILAKNRPGDEASGRLDPPINSRN